MVKKFFTYFAGHLRVTKGSKLSGGLMNSQLLRTFLVICFLSSLVSCKSKSGSESNENSGQNDPPSGSTPVDPSDLDGDGVQNSVDCEPGDASRWENFTYSFRDEDGDGYTVPKTGSFCGGSDFSLPEGYSTVAMGLDCDDSNADVYRELPYRYTDLDSDGYHFQFSDGLARSLCAGASLPNGHYESLVGVRSLGPDCDDRDALRFSSLYQYRDTDGDGHGGPMGKNICGNGLTPELGWTLVSDDCDDSDVLVWEHSEILYFDSDSDGRAFLPGGGFQFCRGRVPAGYISLVGDLYPNDPRRTTESIEQVGLPVELSDGITKPLPATDRAGNLYQYVAGKIEKRRSDGILLWDYTVNPQEGLKQAFLLDGFVYFSSYVPVFGADKYHLSKLDPEGNFMGKRIFTEVSSAASVRLELTIVDLTHEPDGSLLIFGNHVEAFTSAYPSPYYKPYRSGVSGDLVMRLSPAMELDWIHQLPTTN